jgi:hypothetical protein
VLREIQPTLAPGDQGPEVANLKAALLFLLAQGYFLSSDPPEPYTPRPAQGPDRQPTPAELQQLADTLRRSVQWDPTLPPVALPRQSYDEATQTLVAFFQAQENLADPVGFVADATAKLLNAWLRQRGAFEEEKRRLQGLVRQRASGTPLAGVLVRALLVIGNDSHPLGESRSSADGIYAIVLDPATLSAKVPPGEPIPLLVQALDDTETVIAEAERSIPPEEVLTLVDLEVGAPEYPGENPEDRFLVQGTVRLADGTPLAGAAVKAYDVDLRSLSPLGDQAITSAEGSYAIPYSRAQFTRAEKGSADLLLRLFEPGNGPELLGFNASDGSGQPIATLLLPQAGAVETPRAVWFNAPALATINLTLLASEPAPSQWLALTRTLVPLLGELWPHELNVTDRVFLERETELNSESLQAWILAAQAAKAFNLLNSDLLAPYTDWLAPIRDSAGKRPSAYLVEWIAFYGWFREATGSDARQLLQTPSEGLIQNLLSAINRNTIPDLQTKGSGDQTLLEVIREALNRQRLLLALEPAPEGQPASIGDVLNAVGADWLAPDLRLRVAEAWPALNPDGVDFPAILSNLEVNPEDQRKLAQTLRLDQLTLHHPGLIAALQAHVPAQPEAFSPEATLTGLTTLEPDQWLDLVYTHNTPAGSVLAPEDYARSLGRETENSLPTLSLLAKIESGKRLLQPENREVIVTLLQRPGFNIVSADLGAITENPEVPDGVVTDLHCLQALKRAGASWDLTQSLLDRGISSMDTIVNLGRHSLEDLLQDDPHADEIAEVHATAAIYGALGLGLINTMAPAIWGVGSAVMRSQTPTAPELAENATLRRLFGALEQCACEPCLSVLSPAAYYVDLLRYVDSNLMAAYTLKQRRPDLYDLELSCDNTQIELPQIDLALEILENAAALPNAISLPSGTNAEAELRSNQIGAEVKAALQETALETIGSPLTATADQWTVRSTRLEPGATYWVIADRYRRWVVKAQREVFGIDWLVGLSQGLSLSVINVGSLLQWMNQGPHFPVPNQAWRSGFLQMLNRNSSFQATPLTASLTRLTVTTLEPSRRWRVDYAVGGGVTVGQSAGQMVPLTLASADGTDTQTRQYNRPSIQATIAELNAGRLGGIFANYYLTSSSIQVQTTATGWSYSQTLSEEVIYNPASLTIEGLSYQSTANDRNLLVRPQHQNPLAYALLRNSTRVFPWSLPYDQALTEIRALLEEAGHSRLALLEATMPESELVNSDLWAREQLGLSKGEAEAILSSRSGDALWRTWGLRPTTGADWSVVDTYADAKRVALPLDPRGKGLLQGVSVVLQQARLRFVELQAFLATPFVHGGQPLSLEPITECDPTKLWIKGIDAGMLDRLHRLVRLWRALGWPIWEVDLVLTSLGVNASTAPFSAESLRRLAQLQALKAHLQLPMEVLATMFAGFSDRIYSTIDRHETLQPLVSLYSRIFLRKALQPTQPPTPPTPPPPSLAFAQTLPTLDDALLAVIATALGARPADLKGLLDARVRDLQQIQWNRPLPLNQNGNQKGLLHLWRNTVLAKVLGLPWGEYLAACRLLKADPFASPANLLLFCREVRFMVETGVNIAALERILTNQQAPESQDPWLLPMDTAAVVFSTLQTGLQAVANPEPQPLRPVGLRAEELQAPPFQAPADAAERWRRWRLNPVPNSTTRFSVPSPYPAPAASTSPVPPLTGTPLALLKQVAVLAQQAGLSSSEFEAVLQTRYVAPDAQSLNDLRISSTAGQPAVLNRLRVASLTTYLDRIEQFVALQRALAVPTPELDLLIETLGAATNLANLLRDNAAAAIFTIRDRLNLQLDEVLAWWGALVGRQMGVFERLFYPTRPGQRWRLNAARTALDTPPSNWREGIPSLASAFAVDPSDVSYLIAAGIVPEPVNLANLAVVHHWLNLAKALGIHTRLLHYLRNRSFPTPPSTVPAPAELLGFLTEIGPLKQKIDLVIQQLAAASELEPGITGDQLLDHLSITSNGVQRPALDLFLTPDFAETASNSATVSSSPAYGVLMKLRKVAWLNNVWQADRERLRWLRRFSWSPAFQGVIPDHFHGEGLVGEYFTNPTLFPPAAFRRLDAAIDYRWEAGSPANGLGPDLFSIRWQGQLQAPATGTFTFTTRSDDGVRLWVNGQLLIDNWTDHPPTENSGTIDLVADLRYDIVLEYYERQGGATIEFYWSAPALGIARQLVKALHPVIPYQQWKQTTQLYAALRSQPQLQSVLEDYRNSLGGSAQRRDVNKARSVLGAAFGLSLDDVNWCAIQWQLDTTASLALNQADWLAQTDPLRLSGVFKLLATLQQLGTTTTELVSLLAESPSPATAAVAQRILRSRHGESTWQEALRSVNNRLRIEQRDRLVDHLLWEKDLRDANSLYLRYYIDVQMAPCMRTTRLLQATAAVQLFVQRCLLNEEGNVSPGLFDAKRWEWMQYYRIWEANRKVFLYPENWLRQEFRDDCTEAFEVFQTALSQNQPTHESAQGALRCFLEKLAEIGSIEPITGFHALSENPANTIGSQVGIQQTCYLLGRTSAEPHSYYWRRSAPFKDAPTQWQGWQSIKASITSEHVHLFVVGATLFLAWSDVTSTNITGKEINLRICWTKLLETGWDDVKQSAIITVSHEHPALDPAWSMHFTGSPSINGTTYSLRPYTALKAVPSFSSAISAYIDKLSDTVPPSQPRQQYTDLTLSLGAKLIYPDTGQQLLVGPSGFLVDIYGIELKPGWVVSAAQSTSHIACTAKPTGSKIYASANLFPIKFRVYGTPPASVVISISIAPNTPNAGANKSQTVTLTLPGLPSSRPGGRYNASVEATFLANVNDPESSLREGISISMKSNGHFIFDQGDWKWEENPAQDLLPPEGFYFLNSGLKESFPGSRGVDLISGSQAGVKLWARQVDHDWRLNGILNKTFLASEKSNYLLATSLQTTNQLIPHLLSFTEGSLYRTTAMRSPSELFDLRMQSDPINPRFLIERLASYDANPTQVSPHRDPRLLNPLKGQHVQFHPSQPNSVYNWEVFYHLPMMAANFLSQQHRFADARRWFHYIFDPTTDDPSPGRERFWRFLPFRHTNQSPTIVQLLNILANPQAPAIDKQQVQDQIEAWLADPFNPFAIARLRTSAFEWSTTISYIKNLFDWGDHFFRRDTRESINEATLLYVIAAQILGRRSEKVTSSFAKGAVSYRNIQGQWDAFSNTWISLAPFVQALINSLKQLGGINPSANQQMIDTLQKLASIGSTYFCVPPNDKIIELWDLVADRLFKIRNCQNIDGVLRDLPLYDPPIDPELLIRARRAGLDLADVLADRYAPLPIYRLQAQMQKANELCSEVKTLGSALLSAIEKKEVEHLSLLRSSHELTMHKLVEQVKQDQISEAAANIEALKKTRGNARDRVSYLQRQLGKYHIEYDTQNVPIIEQSLITQVQGKLDFTGDEDSLALIQREVDQLSWLNTANNWSIAAGSSKAAAGVFHALATSENLKPWAEPAGHAASAVGDGLGVLSSNAKTWEQWNGLIAAWQRRRDDWVHQSRTTVEEIRQLDKQIAALDIRKGIAEKELANHRKQIEHTREIDDYIRIQKLSRESLYSWMESQLASVYFTAYQLAYDQAKRAERALRFELGDDSTNFIQAGHWDGLQNGLLAGERLAQDLRRMEVAHLERNRRELEITKHISLLQLDPLALIQLRATGSCEITIPERLFDLDFPGHFFRRVKAVSLSIPCVVGPYTSINATLTLLSSQLRDTKQVKGGSYDSPENYRSSYLPIQSIATSGAQNDSGLFELNFRDERYLPFEGAGAISTWQLSLPSEFRQFDYDTISDVILHLRYTARDGGDALKTDSLDQLRRNPAPEAAPPFFLVLEPRQDFPNEWLRFLTPSPAGSRHTLSVSLTSDLFPLRDAKRSLKLTRLWLFARCVNQGVYSVEFNDNFSIGTPALKKSASFNGFHFALQDLDLPLTLDTPLPLEITITRQGRNVGNEVSDLVLIIGYGWQSSKG